MNLVWIQAAAVSRWSTFAGTQASVLVEVVE